MPRSVYLQAPRGGTTHVSAPRPVQVEEMENENLLCVSDLRFH